MSHFRTLDVAVIGGGIGGMSAALALRRAGHRVSVYERRGFDVEVGASISCAANGTQWLREWGVNIEQGRPVILQHLIMRDWTSGKVLNDYDLEGYEREWGNVYNMFHRQDMHRILLDAATSPSGKGTPCSVVVDHICQSIDADKGTVLFQNGKTIQADLIIGADGIRSAVREQLGNVPNKTSAPQTCYRVNVKRDQVERLGLDWAADPAIQFWGGYPDADRSQYYKVVMSPCAGGDIVSFYLFMPTELTNHLEEGFVFAEAAVDDILVGDYTQLDPNCRTLIEHSVERRPWRLYVHEPYPFWFKGRACIMGDAAKPMMPHQSQGACQAIEDAAALGILFSEQYSHFTNDVAAGLAMYQHIRFPRGTRVQEASRRALENLNERIGFSSLDAPSAALAAKANKLTVEEMNRYDMHAHIAAEVAKSSEREFYTPAPQADARGAVAALG